MICKITRGKRVADIASYLHGPGRHNEHVYGGEMGGAVIGGTAGKRGDRRGIGWSVDLRTAAEVRPDIGRPIWQMSMRCAPNDRRLTDAEWRTAVTLMAEQMGFEEHPYVIVRHADDHVHVVMSRVADDGTIWVGKREGIRAQQARLQVEKLFGLQATATVRSDHNVRLSTGEQRRAERTGELEPRDWLAREVRDARDAATGHGRDGFEAELARRGVEFKVNIASTGRVSGYSFHAPRHTNAQGEPVWFRASQVAREFGWSKLDAAINKHAKTPLIASAQTRQSTPPADEVTRLQAAIRARTRELVPAIREQLRADVETWRQLRAQPLRSRELGELQVKMYQRYGSIPPQSSGPDEMRAWAQRAGEHALASDETIAGLTAARLTAINHPGAASRETARSDVNLTRSPERDQQRDRGRSF